MQSCTFGHDLFVILRALASDVSFVTMITLAHDEWPFRLVMAAITTMALLFPSIFRQEKDSRTLAHHDININDNKNIQDAATPVTRVPESHRSTYTTKHRSRRTVVER